MTSLTLDALTKTFTRAGTVVDSIGLRIAAGEFFTLLGPSGCGKSTILRMIAGFEQPTSGRILFDDRDVTFVPPNRRNIGFVFQNYALFPQMSVARNVAFGLSVRKTPAAEMAKRVAEALKQVQLEGLNDARIDQLSGGQQQRVALARALVISPALLLLDEPLSNLDAKLREETRAALRALHNATGVTTIYVTHDQTEAMGMSDRIAVLSRGHLQQVASPEEIYDRPANRFVADFIGRNNVLKATVARVDGDRAFVTLTNGLEIPVDATRRAADVVLEPGRVVGVCVRAESLRLSADGGTLRGVVADVEYVGAARSCSVQTDVGRIRVEIPSGASSFAVGETIGLMFSTTHLILI